MSTQTKRNATTVDLKKGIPGNSNKNKTHKNYVNASNNLSKCTKCSTNANLKNKKESAKTTAYKTLLTKKSIRYRDKIIQILTPGWFSSAKKLSIQEIEKIAKYLNILNTIYNDYAVSNRKDIYNYIITELTKKTSLDKDFILPFINKIRYKDDPNPNLNTDAFNKIKSEFINVLNTLPAP